MSTQPIRQFVSDITSDAETDDQRYDAAQTRFREADPRTDGILIGGTLEQMIEARLSLGVLGHDRLEVKRLRALRDRFAAADPEKRVILHAAALEFLDLRDAIHAAAPGAPRLDRLVPAIRAAETALDELLFERRPGQVRRGFDAVARRGVDGLDRTFRIVGRVAAAAAQPLSRVGGRSLPARAVRGAGALIDGFLSYESLRRSGLETSWGVRTYIPGTFGVTGNAGPWVMAYSGRLIDAQARTQPMRINPGATLATPVWIGTVNRPGLGAGGAFGAASAYIDRARYKLLLGIDGVLYVRIGDWVGRGPYFTVSASIPITPMTSVTWNASLFSPGFAPLVRWSTPIAFWVRRRTMRLQRAMRRLVSRSGSRA